MPTVGEHLRSVREEQGRSLEEIGEALKIRVDHVQALEEGDFEPFTAPIFVRGFVRSYCRILKLDSAPLVEALNCELSGSDQLQETAPYGSKRLGLLNFATFQLSRVNWSIALPLLALALLVSVITLLVKVYEDHRDHIEKSDWLGELPAAVHTPSLRSMDLPLRVPQDLPTPVGESDSTNAPVQPKRS